ncbi:MAG: tetratricopeptide repeat protein, partial [Planctomycetota bacterium]
AFGERYWGEVFAALADSGIDKDVRALVGAALRIKDEAELERLWKRAEELLEGVPWARMAGQEHALAERFARVGPSDAPPILMNDVVWLLRTDAAEESYAGLVALLEGFVAEVNRAVDSQALTVERQTPHGAELVSVNLLAAIPTAPTLPISVARREGLVLLAFGAQLRDDVLALLAGAGAPPALAASPRFQAAFAKLPPHEDARTFFDLNALVSSLQSHLSALFRQALSTGDVYLNAGQKRAASQQNARALEAYNRGDYETALERVQKAYELAPDDSIVLYNLACFHALLGHQEAALDWLERAVAGGFYAPAKIAGDSDLKSLRDEQRYQAALAQARQLAEQHRAGDVVVNSSKTGEAFALFTQALQAYEQKEYERGLQLMEQAYAVAPQDARVLYGLACFHAVLGHTDQALDFLERAVAGGFYCPRHIAKDPDWERLREHPRYRAALAAARQSAACAGGREAPDAAALVKGLL